MPNFIVESRFMGKVYQMLNYYYTGWIGALTFEISRDAVRSLAVDDVSSCHMAAWSGEQPFGTEKRP